MVTKKQHLAAEKKQKIAAAMVMGRITVNEAHRQYKLSKPTLYAMKRSYEQGFLFRRQIGSGRPSKLTPR